MAYQGASSLTPEQKKLEKQAKDRLDACRRRKAEIEMDLREGYFFTAPQRAREVNSLTAVSNERQQDVSELQISLGMEVSQDFATEVIESFMPATTPWLKQKAGFAIPQNVKDQVDEQIKIQSAIVLASMKSSDFYDAISMAYKPDLGIGTVGVWIDRFNLWEPPKTVAVPIRELEINVGPFAKIDDRFWVKRVMYRSIRAELGAEIDLPAEITKKIDKSPNQTCRLTRGFWRLWDDPRDCFWQEVVLLDDKLIDSRVLQGEGSCPLIVTRFDPDPLFPFGAGPTIKSLPEFRRLDETEALKIENADFQIHPPFVYPDDGVINFSQGIEPGMGYPARAGTTGREFVKLAFEGNVDFAAFETMRIEERIKRLHFVDYPVQPGKTPPTAQQWLDEMMMRQRRIGTPGKIFWREGPREYFMRFKYILEERGVIEPVQVNGSTVSVEPYNPTEIAQDNQEVAQANRLLQTALSAFPTVAELVIDAEKTITNLKKKMGDTIVELRDEKGIESAAALFADRRPAAGGQPVPGAGT